MKSLLTFTGAGLLALLLSATTLPENRVRPFTYRYENVLGTSLELKVLAGSEAIADQAEAASLAEIERQAKILSSWDPASEFSNWSREVGRATPVSPELIEVLEALRPMAGSYWRALSMPRRKPSLACGRWPPPSGVCSHRRRNRCGHHRRKGPPLDARPGAWHGHPSGSHAAGAQFLREKLYRGTRGPAPRLPPGA